MKLRREHALLVLLAAACVALVVMVTYGQRTANRGGGVLSAVPRDAWLVVVADAASLRASPLVQPLLGSGSSTIVPGLGPLTDACGFDPLTRIDRVVLCSPEDGERGDFGVAITGTFTREELTRCADKISRARGVQPTTTTRGDFGILEDPSDPKHTRFAYREGGPFLVGRGPWFDAMVDAADGKTPGERPEHAALREALSPAGSTPSLLVTALLPSTVREHLKSELSSEVTEGDKLYASVLSVSSVGLALTTNPTTTHLAGELRCETPSSCADVASLIDAKRKSFSKDFAVRILGLTPLLDSLSETPTGPTLSLTAQAPTPDLTKALTRLLAFRSRSSPPTAHSPTPPLAQPAQPPPVPRP